MTEQINFDELEEDGQLVVATEKQLASLSELVDELDTLEQRKARGEALLKTVSERIREIEDRLLPDAMERARTLEHRSEGCGKRVVLKDIIKANMPSTDPDDAEAVAKMAKAIKWLEDNDLSGIISRKLEVDFGKEDTEMVQRIVELITRETNGVFAPIVRNAVNYQTLNASLRSRKEAGKPTPSDNGSDGFTVFNGRRATLKAVKR
jgi:hypothetical protein